MHPAAVPSHSFQLLYIKQAVWSEYQFNVRAPHLLFFIFRQHLSVMHLKNSNSSITFPFLKTLILTAYFPTLNIM